MSRHPDSLIARKCGAEVAANAAMQAKRVLDTNGPDDADYQDALGGSRFLVARKTATGAIREPRPT